MSSPAAEPAPPRSPGDTRLLQRLARTECLLALARLPADGHQPARYAEAALDAIARFVPLHHGRIVLRRDGAELARIVVGAPVAEGALAHEAPLTAEGVPVGLVRLVPSTPGLVTPDFVAEVAAVLSPNLRALLDDSRLRRSVAAATAVYLAGALSATPSPAEATELARAVASIPGVRGARVLLPIPSGPHVAGVAGGAGLGDRPAATGEPAGTDGLEGRYQIARDPVGPSLQVRWAADATDGDREAVETVRASLERSAADGRHREQLRTAAEVDPLTGVGNRRRSDRVLAEEAVAAATSRLAVAVLYLDLDHFKRINDELGHEVGDGVLARFASEVSTELRAADTLCRHGGEEFLLICPGLDTESGRSVGARIVERAPTICAPLLPAGWRQTVSVGLAVHPVAGTMRQTVAAADRALYRAKRAGRDRCVVAPPSN